jgi:catechol 2,3-dioxygenase-like lactoylglutathione lyase family enzyme
MDVAAIDHVNLTIPADGVERAVEFYGSTLGFDVENRDLYEADEKPFVPVRLAPDAVIHLAPDEAFEPPSGSGFDHVALVLEASITEIRLWLDAAGVEIERSLEPLGATGTAPAVYVRDPFGYVIELKAAIAE